MNSSTTKAARYYAVMRLIKKMEYGFGVKHLMKLTGLGTWQARGLIVSILLFTKNSNCPSGNIGRFSNEAIALVLDIPLDEIDGLIAALVEAGWLEEHPEHRLVVCGWTDAA